jgi:YfiH family protein
MQLPWGWITPDWPVPANVRAACSIRTDGVSRPPYDSLNLGDHVGDASDAVAANRDSYAQALGARPVFMKQVHGWHVESLMQDTPHAVEADACVTTQRKLACTIMVADCMPVLFASRDGSVVAAAHAGWRGLSGNAGRGVFEATWGALRSTSSGLQPGDVHVWLGPCIGPTAFEVGPEVKTAFEGADAGSTDCFVAHTPGKYLADLPALARRRLAALGFTSIHGNDGSTRWCTVNNPSLFFSHRRDRISGRFAASVWRA